MTLAAGLLAALLSQASAEDFFARLSRYGDAVECARPYVAASVLEETGKTLSDSTCINAAPVLLSMLGRAGLRGLLPILTNTGHYFLRTLDEGHPVYIDPTIRQFFGGAQAPPEVPEIFVGTFEDLERLFSRFKASAHVRDVYLDGADDPELQYEARQEIRFNTAIKARERAFAAHASDARCRPKD
ncbi:MAG: hypothetical protein HY078_09445 [Elusimicrobia bacterium]|nr:hypothetical protein [Elusimicrobiota bacterium]